MDMDIKGLLIGGLMMVGILAGGCAALTPSQIKAVNALSISSDSVAIAPSALFKSLAKIRQERGVYYAASLQSPGLRMGELEAISAAGVKDRKMAESADLCVKVLSSYLRALRSVSNTARWTSLGTDVRTLTANMDSLIMRYNQLELSEPLPEGWLKASGKLTAYLGENYMRNRQARAVKDFVASGDTLVGVCCDALVALLLKEEVQQLIQNEKEGLKNNYAAYLASLEQRSVFSPVEEDRKYLALSSSLNEALELRDDCAQGLRSLKRAHHRLLTTLKKRQRVQYYYDELLEFNTLLWKLNQL